MGHIHGYLAETGRITINAVIDLSKDEEHMARRRCEGRTDPEEPS